MRKCGTRSRTLFSVVGTCLTVSLLSAMIETVDGDVACRKRIGMDPRIIGSMEGNSEGGMGITGSVGTSKKMVSMYGSEIMGNYAHVFYLSFLKPARKSDHV